MRTNKRAQFALAYVAGLCIAPVYFLLKWIGLIKIEFPERLPRWERSMLIVSNHPSLLEPFLIPLLFFSEWVWFPVRWGPWSTPDRTNLKARLSWFFWVGGARNISIPRKREKGENNEEFLQAMHAALRKIRAVLRIGGRVVIFPEGGRTTSVPATERLKSPKGNELRPLRKRTGDIVVESCPTVLPIWIRYPWVENPKKGWLPIKTRIGEPMQFDSGLDAKVVVKRLQDALLALADEGED